MASASENTIKNNAHKTNRNTACASGSLLPEIKRKPSDSSVRIEARDCTAIGRTRLGELSDILRRTCNCSGGRDGSEDRYTWDDRYVDRKRGLRGEKLSTPN